MDESQAKRGDPVSLLHDMQISCEWPGCDKWAAGLMLCGDEKEWWACDFHAGYPVDEWCYAIDPTRYPPPTIMRAAG
jgi:hypothetical protein